MKVETVCAVVVTFNRKKLLLETLNSLLHQEHKLDGIIIVDNASSDGTDILLLENNFIDHLPCKEKSTNKENLLSIKDHIKIYYIRMSKNLGGAGGFYEGLKAGYKFGYDCLWLMDDDVISQKNTLNELFNVIENNSEIGFLCSRVVGTNGVSMNVPTIDYKRGVNDYPTWDEKLDKGLIKVHNATFVSVLISRMVIRDVGLPIKEMFLWGDDTEYTTRISEKYPCYFSGKSVVVHKRKMQKSLDLLHEEDDIRINNYYYFFRNNVYIARKYFDKKYLIKYLLRIIIYSIKIFLVKNKLRKVKVLYKGVFCGLFFNPHVMSKMCS